MATAYVAGVAALYLEKYPNTSPSQFKKKLIDSARDLGSPGWDTKYGYGLIDAYYLLFGLKADFTWSPKTIHPGTEITFTSKSKCLDGKITIWAWDFENDGKDDDWGKEVTHRYLKTGTYTVALWTKTNNGKTKICYHTINVKKKSRSLEIKR